MGGGSKVKPPVSKRIHLIYNYLVMIALNLTVRVLSLDIIDFGCWIADKIYKIRVTYCIDAKSVIFVFESVLIFIDLIILV